MAGGGHVNPVFLSWGPKRSGGPPGRAFLKRSGREEAAGRGKKCEPAVSRARRFAIGPSSRSRAMGALHAINRETNGAGGVAFVMNRMRGVGKAGCVYVPGSQLQSWLPSRARRWTTTTSSGHAGSNAHRRRLQPRRQGVGHRKQSLRFGPARDAARRSSANARAGPTGWRLALRSTPGIVLPDAKRPLQTAKGPLRFGRGFQETSDLIRAVLSVSRPPPALV